MIEITSLASGSSGNCYKISDGSSSLLIEAGIPINEIKEKLDYRLSEIDGCLVSHEHGDHSKAVEDIMAAGIDCYMSRETQKKLGIISHRIHAISTSEQLTLGNSHWGILSFNIHHDAADPYGFLITNRNKDILLYASDTFYLKYRFEGLTHIMIECNYATDILDYNIRTGRVPAVQKKRLFKTHMSLQTCKDFLRANDLSRVKEIWLLHLSDRNSNAESFKREVQELSGKPTYVAGD